MRIALVSPSRNAYSETFIRAHIDRLEGEKLVLIDGHLPTRNADGSALLGRDFFHRAMRRVNGWSMEESLRRTVISRLKEFKADVVLAEFGPTGEAMLDVCAAARIPLVVHFHGVDAFHVDLLARHGNYRRIIAAGVHIVVVSREMERQLIALGARADRVHYNCYGIDVDRFCAGDPVSAGQRFVAVGRFVEKKAPQLTLLAFDRALREEPGMELVMLGDGPLLGPVTAMARALGIAGKIRFEGVADPDRVLAAMSNARAFVQHSVISAQNDREGTPLAVLEAMACGLPVIATRHGGIPDVVEHERTGWLVEEGDIAAMAGHMVRAAREPALASTLGKAGRERVVQHHRVEDSIAKLQGILATALGS